jgi:diguanylate cyclase (GGDEF)-like protein
MYGASTPGQADQSSGEHVLRSLWSITDEYDRGLEHQLGRTLELGRALFEAECAAVGHWFRGRFVELGRVGLVDVELPPLVLQSQVEQTGLLVASDLQRLNGRFPPGAWLGASLGDSGRLLGFYRRTPRARPFRPAELDAFELIARWLRVELDRRAKEQRLLREAEEAHRLTRIDPLTELLNRRGVELVLDRVAERSRRLGEPVCALLVDLDDFKGVNEAYGHHVGDRVLKAAAAALAHGLRPTDPVARIGGDEFLAVLAGSGRSEALRAARRVLSSLRGAGVEVGGHRLALTASIAAVEVDPSDVRLERLLQAAAPRLRASKQLGKDRVTG